MCLKTAVFTITIALSARVFATAELFVDVAMEAGANVRHLPPIFDQRMQHIMSMVAAGASGGAIGDYDKDGWLDIFVNVPRRGVSNKLLRNNGDMTFTDEALKAGLGDINTKNSVATTGIFFDYDGDGWQDLLVVRFGTPLLFRNRRNGRFEDVSEQAGFDKPMNALAAIAFDYDKDGDLDLYFGSYFRDLDMFNLGNKEKNILHDSWEVSRNGGSNAFYVNNGNGTFTQRTHEVGVTDTGWTMALAHGDFDGDGWQDIYVANDYGRDVVFQNKGDGTFKDMSQPMIGTDTKKGMNAEAADMDNDGDLDIFVTNVTEEFLYECNMLWQNSGDGMFVDVSQEMGVCDTGWGWGGKFFDYNNDGWLDLYVANGFFTGEVDKSYLDVLLPAIWESGEDPSDPKTWPPLNGMGMASAEKNVLFTNKKGKFIREAKSGLELAKDSRAVLTADFNNDGRVDVYVTNNAENASLYENRAEGGHWLQLVLEGTPPNTDAVGARIYAQADNISQMREVNIGNGFAGGSMIRQHFGFGREKNVDKLIVVWPDGTSHSYTNVATDRIVHLRQSKYGIEEARIK